MQDWSHCRELIHRHGVSICITRLICSTCLVVFLSSLTSYMKLAGRFWKSWGRLTLSMHLVQILSFYWNPISSLTFVSLKVFFVILCSLTMCVSVLSHLCPLITLFWFPLESYISWLAFQYINLICVKIAAGCRLL